MWKFLASFFVVGILSQQKCFVSGVAPLHGGSSFPRFKEFPDSISETEGLSGIEIDSNSPAARFRLPNQIVPRYYKLELRPILNEGSEPRFTAPGLVEITVECVQATRSLVLHASELTINESTIKVSRADDPNAELTIQRTSFQLLEQTFTIEVEEVLDEGRLYNIRIDYVATIADPADRMNGIYWSSYVNDEGQTRYLATTQFSRTRAFRKTLPSFDEPSQKAVFEISIGRQDPYHTLSNMNIRISEQIEGMEGWTWDRYHPTPVMPPTIIAFIISDFESETAPADLFHPDKPVKIWGPPPDMKNGGAVFAAQAAARTLKHFEEYFQIEYELPKIDSAAIPDFAAGAMENWGLNTYRVIYLIWNQGINTAAEKFRIGNIIGHELAHQFWGNLVTHAWWNDWWLTEGFASYYEYASLQYIHPEFEATYRALTSDMQPAMDFDAGLDSVPIHGNVTTEFVENPSVINYQKGASLVRMMEGFLSEEVFRKSLNHYLTKRSYQAVHQDALFEDIHEYLVENNAVPSNGKTMKEIMDTWTLQTSFPLLRISSAGANRVLVSQERFENLAVKSNDEKSTELWYVPVGYVTATDPSFQEPNTMPKFWLNNNTLITSHEVNTNQWIVFNPDGKSYYRVLYDTHFANLLKVQLESNVDSIGIGSRSMIVDDYFVFANQWYISIADALSMTKFMEKETDYNVWSPFLKHLRKTLDLFSSDAEKLNPFKTYVLNSMRTVFAKIGYEQTTTEIEAWTILRVLLFDWACSLGDSGCVTEANRLIGLWQQDSSTNPVPVDIRQFIYCAAAMTETNWNFLESQYDTTKDIMLLNSLACSTTAATLQRLLGKALTPGAIEDAHVVTLIQRVAMNSDGRPLVIEFLQTNFAQLAADDSNVRVSGIASIISTLSTYTGHVEDRNKINTLVNENLVILEPVMTSLNTSLSRISANIQWMSEFGSSILTWLLKL